VARKSTYLHKLKELRRHPDPPRFYQRGEGSRADRLCSQPLHARSLARLKNAALRDDAFGSHNTEQF